jgi:hypothetical protein
MNYKIKDDDINKERQISIKYVILSQIIYILNFLFFFGVKNVYLIIAFLYYPIMTSNPIINIINKREIIQTFSDAFGNIYKNIQEGGQSILRL